MKTRNYLKYLVRDCHFLQPFGFNSSYVFSNFICLTRLITLRSSAKLLFKIRAAHMQQSANICVT